MVLFAASSRAPNESKICLQLAHTHGAGGASIAGVAIVGGGALFVAAAGVAGGRAPRGGAPRGGGRGGCAAAGGGLGGLGAAASGGGLFILLGTHLTRALLCDELLTWRRPVLF